MGLRVIIIEGSWGRVRVPLKGSTRVPLKVLLRGSLEGLRV